MIEGLRERLEAALQTFETYEKPIEQEAIEEATSAICGLYEELYKIPLPRISYIGAVLEPGIYGDPVEISRQRAALERSREQVEKVRIMLAAYKPHARSQAQRYLRQRRSLIHEMREILEAVKQIQPSSDRGKQRKARPEYIRVVQLEDEETG